jgi:hypothetical protein
MLVNEDPKYTPKCAQHDSKNCPKSPNADLERRRQQLACEHLAKYGQYATLPSHLRDLAAFRKSEELFRIVKKGV